MPPRASIGRPACVPFTEIRRTCPAHKPLWSWNKPTHPTVANGTLGSKRLPLGCPIIPYWNTDIDPTDIGNSNTMSEGRPRLPTAAPYSKGKCAPLGPSGPEIAN